MTNKKEESQTGAVILAIPFIIVNVCIYAFTIEKIAKWFDLWSDYTFSEYIGIVFIIQFIVNVAKPGKPSDVTYYKLFESIITYTIITPLIYLAFAYIAHLLVF